MKKFLIASSALVAVAGFAGAAQAADPIKLSVGGFGAFAVGVASQDSEFTDNDTGATNNPGMDYAGWDVKGNNEVHFSGATTLDNGLSVSVAYEFEAGGRSMADPSDKWSVTLGSTFGTLLVGTDDAATVMIAKGHKDVSGAVNGFDEGDVLAGSWVANAGVTYLDATFINTASEAEKITYVSPTFAGFTFGATAAPALDDTNGDTSSMPVGTAPTAGAVGTPAVAGSSPVEDVYGIGAMWNGEFSGASIGVEAGWVTASPGAAVTSTGSQNQNLDDRSEWQAGATVSMAGFTIGAAYRNVDLDLNARGTAINGTGSLDMTAWEAGVAYETGPYGVSLGYFKSNVDNAVGVADDEVAMWQLSGSYNMGPGVDMKFSAATIEFDDGNTNNAAIPGNSDNEGTAVMTGMTLAF